MEEKREGRKKMGREVGRRKIIEIKEDTNR